MYVRSHHQKEYLIRVAYCSFREEYAECISYLGECVQQIHSWLSNPWLIHKAKTGEPKTELQQRQTGLTGGSDRSDRWGPL
jgi:hypothetical protein